MNLALVPVPALTLNPPRPPPEQVSKQRLGQQKQGKSTLQFKRSVWTGEKESRDPSPVPAAAVLSRELQLPDNSTAQLQTLRSPREEEEEGVVVEEEEEEAAVAASEEEETEDVAVGRPQWQLQAAVEGVA